MEELLKIKLLILEFDVMEEERYFHKSYSVGSSYDSRTQVERFYLRDKHNIEYEVSEQQWNDIFEICCNKNFSDDFITLFLDNFVMIILDDK